jgi:hypothetical protein
MVFYNLFVSIFCNYLDKGNDDIIDPLPIYCRRHSSFDTSTLMHHPTKPRLSITLFQIREEQKLAVDN